MPDQNNLKDLNTAINRGFVGPATAGLLPSQSIKAMIDGDLITAVTRIDPAQIQPASLDLRLGDIAYRVQASFLPGKNTSVRTVLEQLTMHQMDLRPGAVLEQGCVYIVPLQEHLLLTPAFSAITNPKSSTGRLDVFSRLITDNAVEFDSVAAGYAGPLYLEIAPCTFSILARTGDRLNQIRFSQERSKLSDADLAELHARTPLVRDGAVHGLMDRGLKFTVDLAGDGARIIGYRARPHAPVIDLRRIAYYQPKTFWEPVMSDTKKGIILNPGDFYILATQESVSVPPDLAAEMLAYDTLLGEFRVHYAGFFDPGFGWEAAGGKGSKGVLEVRSHDVPFLLEHGQTTGRLVYERLSAKPEMTYGETISSNYQRQGLKLGKQFKDFTP